jgi:YD repeat-containing protein
VNRHTPRALAFLAALLAALAAFGQQHPNVKKGFAVDSSYQLGDVDNVNIFNGNLVVQIPVGPRYPVGGAISYGFSLTYNSKLWDMENAGSLGALGKPAMRVQPSHRSNAGLGWLMSFGRILDGDSPANKTKALVYESPDGGEHRIYCTLHKDEEPSYPCHDEVLPTRVDPGMAQGYTRDGTYLRMKIEPDNPDRTPKHLHRASIEFPDGSKHIFEDDDDNRQMRIIEMRDRFDNFVKFTYSTDNLTWTVKDSHNRTHIVKFVATPGATTATQANYQTRLDSIEVAKWNGGPNAIYKFHYLDNRQTQRGCIPPYYDYEGSANPTVPLLSQIDIPTGDSSEVQRYTFTYYATHSDCGSGGIQRLTLPTGGLIDYDYQRYKMPTSVCTADAVLNETGGVKSRIVTDGARTSNNKYTWLYKTELTAAGGTDACAAGIGLANPPDVYKELRNTVTTPTNEIVTHWFSIWPKQAASTEGFKREEYGLPLTHSVPAVNGRFLSTTTQFNNTLKIKEYVSYELDPLAGDEPFATMDPDRNRRVNGTRTEHTEGTQVITHSDTENTDFDGLGHYRVVATDVNFDGVKDRTTTTTYNPGKKLPTGTFPKPPTIGHFAEWLLETFTSRTVTENIPTGGTSTLKSDFCFNASTGFLEARRTLKGTSEANDDLLVTFAHDHGNVTSEKYFGGDVVHTSGSGCGPADNTELPTYSITRDWDFGSIHTEGYDGSGFLTVDNDIDPSTGLVTKGRDSAGIFTSYTYDSLGRLKSVTPQTGHGPTFSYKYGIDTSPHVEVTATSGGQEVGHKFVRFDDLGRPMLEFTRMPAAGEWSVRGFEYDGKNRQTRISQPESYTNNPSSAPPSLRPASATTIVYDYLGRQTEITPPDGAAHKITHKFKGISEEVETVFRFDGVNRPERPALTTRLFDGLGRLTQVTESSVSTSSNQVKGGNAITDYTYDAADRLIAVKMSGDGATQNRKFIYDPRGFMKTEQHPEATSDTVYSAFDSRGHATKRTFAGKTLSLEYDKAERLHIVSDQDGILKQFDFAKVNNSSTDLSRGKLVQATRRNDLASGQVDVTEKYEYAEAAGQVSKRTTIVEKVNGSTRTPIQEFAYSIDYDAVLQPGTVTMPTCRYNCSTADGLLRVTNTRSEGFLTSVDGFASKLIPFATLTYHPTGMVENVEHATPRKPVDKYAEQNNMARPSKITFTGCADLTPYFLPGSLLVKPDSNSCGLRVTWPPAVSCGSGADVRYKVERNGQPLAACVSDVKYIDASAQPNVSYTYTVTAEGPEAEGGTGGCHHGRTVAMTSLPSTFKGCATETNLSANPVSASVGIPASFTANLSSSNGFAQDEELIFSVFGREIGRARTGTTGFAILRHAVDAAPGTYENAITVTYAGGILPARSVTANLVVACDAPAYAVKPLFLNVLPGGTPAGSPYQVLVKTSDRCKWQPFPDPGFLQVAPLTQKAGVDLFTVAVPANTSSSTRGAKVRVNFDVLWTDVQVEQSGTGCSFHFSPEIAYVPAESGFATGSIDVSTAPTCAWTVSTDESWLTISAPVGGQPRDPGSGNIRFTVFDNPDPAKRVAHLILKQNGQEVARAAVNQDALPPAVCPVLIEDLRGGSVANGRYIPLRVYVTGTQLKYRWFVNNIPLADCTGPGCAYKLFDRGSSGYPSPGHSSTFQVQVFNSCGMVASDSVTWTNDTPAGSTCGVPTLRDSLFHGASAAPEDVLSPRPGAPVGFYAIAENPPGVTDEIRLQWYHGMPGDKSSKVSDGEGMEITVNPFSTSFYWLEATNNCGSQWSRSGGAFITSPPHRRRAVSHDFNGDQQSDVLWHNSATNQNELWVMSGTSHISTQPLPQNGATEQMQSVGDLNADGRTDIVWRDPQTGNNEVWLMNRTNLSEVRPLESRPGPAWTIGAVADYDNDDSDDIVWHNNATGENELWFGNDTAHAGTWALPNSGGSGLYGTGDFNGDQKPDLFFHDRNTGQNAIWLMDDAERSSVAKTSGPRRLHASSLAMPSMSDTNFVPAEVADFDGDGRPDILWRNSTTGENKVWLLSGTTLSQTVDVETRSGAEWQIGGGGSNNSDTTTGGGGTGTPGNTATALTVTVDPAPLGKAAAVTATLLAGTTPVAHGQLVFSRSGNEFARLLTAPDGTATAVVNVAGLAAGNYPNAITVRFDGDATYNASTASADLLITTAPAVVTWNNPAPIVFGTPLSSAQLNATASVPGTFLYSPAAGSVVGAGYQTLSLTFTPADATIAPIEKTAVILVNKAQSSVTWATPAPIPYGKPLSAAQLNAKSALAGSFEYDPAPGTMLPVGTRTLTVTFEPDSPNYESSATSTTITVEKGSQLVFWNDPAPITALVALGPAQLNARVLPSGTDPAGAVTYDPPLGTLLPAGDHELRVSVAATASYEAASGSVDIRVTPVTASLQWNNPAPIIYGTPLSAAQLNATADVPGVFTYDPPAGTIFNAGTEQLSVTFTPNDSRYEPLSAAVTLQILKAQQSIAWSKPATIVYGTPLSSAQLDATVQAVGPAPAASLEYTPSEGTVLQAGSGQLLTVTAPATDNYDAATATVTIDVLKATPAITWTAPAPIVYGTPLGAQQLGATADVNGTFDYTPPAGTILNAGPGQTLSAHFTPADPHNYNSADLTRTIDVARAQQTLTWSAPAPIVYGTALSAAQLNAAVQVVGPSPAGALTYTPASGTMLNAGLGQTLTVSAAATPNYDPATRSVTLDVRRATLSLTADAKSKVYGAPLPALTGTLTGVVNNDPITPSYATIATQQSGAGTYPITAALNDPNNRLANYDVTITPATLTILRAALQIAANPASKQYSDPLPTLTATFTGFVLGETPAVLAGTLGITTPADAGSAPGTYAISIGGLTSPNYTITYVGSTLTVTAEDARVTITTPPLLAASVSGPTTTITLSATVRDISVTADAAGDTFPGDIRKATLTFVDRATNTTLCTAPIGLVSSSDERSGIATCSFTRPFGTALPATFTVGATVGGYYTRDAAADNLAITVLAATTDRIKGNVKMTIASATGPYAPDLGSEAQVDFNFEYKEKGKDKQKELDASFRVTFDKTESSKKHRYSLSVDTASLAVRRTTAGGQGLVVGTGTLVDDTDKKTIAAGVPFVVTATDNGNDDQLGFALFKADGGLWIATGWNGVQMIEQPTRNGQIKVEYDK